MFGSQCRIILYDIFPEIFCKLKLSAFRKNPVCSCFSFENLNFREKTLCFIEDDGSCEVELICARAISWQHGVGAFPAISYLKLIFTETGKLPLHKDVCLDRAFSVGGRVIRQTRSSLSQPIRS